MTQDPHSGLSAREREMMDIIHRLGEASAQDVRGTMAEAPTDATVRSTLRVLEEKGWLSHRRETGRFLYRAVAGQREARDGALRHVLQTFFDDSPAELMAALVDRRGSRLRAGERKQIKDIIARLEKQDRGR
jgi:predicted transcriptional regulator